MRGIVSSCVNMGYAAVSSPPVTLWSDIGVRENRDPIMIVALCDMTEVSSLVTNTMPLTTD